MNKLARLAHCQLRSLLSWKGLLTITSLTLVTAILVIFIAPHFAAAQIPVLGDIPIPAVSIPLSDKLGALVSGGLSGITSLWKTLIGATTSIIGSIALGVANFAITIITGIVLPGQKSLMLSAELYTAWDAMRNLANILFFVALFIFSIMIITRQGGYNFKKAVVALITAAVLANFSLSLARVIIEIGDALRNSAASLPGLGYQGGDMGSILANWFNGMVNVASLAWESDNDTLKFVFATIIIMIERLFLAYIFVRLAFLLVERAVRLAVLTIFAPIQTVIGILPQKSFENIGTKWINEIIKWTLVLPVSFIVIAIAMLFLPDPGATMTAFNMAILDVGTADGANSWGPIFMMIAGLGVLMQAANAPKLLTLGELGVGKALSSIENYANKGVNYAKSSTQESINSGVTQLSQKKNWLGSATRGVMGRIQYNKDMREARQTSFKEAAKSAGKQRTQDLLDRGSAKMRLATGRVALDLAIRSKENVMLTLPDGTKISAKSLAAKTGNTWNGTITKAVKQFGGIDNLLNALNQSEGGYLDKAFATMDTTRFGGRREEMAKIAGATEPDHDARMIRLAIASTNVSTAMDNAKTAGSALSLPDQAAISQNMQALGKKAGDIADMVLTDSNLDFKNGFYDLMTSTTIDGNLNALKDYFSKRENTSERVQFDEIIASDAPEMAKEKQLEGLLESIVNDPASSLTADDAKAMAQILARGVNRTELANVVKISQALKNASAPAAAETYFKALGAQQTAFGVESKAKKAYGESVPKNEAITQAVSRADAAGRTAPAITNTITGASKTFSSSKDYVKFAAKQLRTNVSKTMTGNRLGAALQANQLGTTNIDQLYDLVSHLGITNIGRHMGINSKERLKNSGLTAGEIIRFLQQVDNSVG